MLLFAQVYQVMGLFYLFKSFKPNVIWNMDFGKLIKLVDKLNNEVHKGQVLRNMYFNFTLHKLWFFY